MKKKLMGLDLGTTVCKATICTLDGRVCGESYLEYQLIKKSAECIEQDADQWWELAKQSIREAINEAGIRGDEIVAIGVCSQAISFVPVDEEIKPIRYALNWADTRAKKQIDEILHKISPDEIFQITGRRPELYYILPKLMWLR